MAVSAARQEKGLKLGGAGYSEQYTGEESTIDSLGAVRPLAGRLSGK